MDANRSPRGFVAENFLFHLVSYKYGEWQRIRTQTAPVEGQSDLWVMEWRSRRTAPSEVQMPHRVATAIQGQEGWTLAEWAQQEQREQRVD